MIIKKFTRTSYLLRTSYGVHCVQHTVQASTRFLNL